MTEQDFEDLKDYTLALNKRVTDLQDSVSLLDSHFQNYNNLFQLEDVTVNYPAENDVLVFDKNGKWKNAQYDTIGVDSEQGGGSGDFYIIGIGDPTPPTNQNVYSAARTKEDFLSSKEEDQADGTITFNKGIITDSIYSKQWQEGPLGYGLVYHLKDSDDQLYTISYMELDELYVRRKATFDTLEIKKLTSVGGRIIVTPASNEIIRVETVTEYYNGSYVDVYRCFFRSDDGENAIKTDFVAGDMAQCRQFNISSTGTHENASNRYYWRLVMGVGADYVDLSMTDMDTATTSDAPAAGDTIVQLGNKNNLARQNAIILSAYDDNAPSISMYQGINNYTTQGHDVMQIAYDTTQDAEQMYFNLYGRMYVGAHDQHTYLKYDPLTETVTIRGKLLVESGTSVEDVIQDVAETIVEQANTELSQKIDDAVDDLMSEINGVETDASAAREDLQQKVAQSIGYSDWNSLIADCITNHNTVIKGGWITTGMITAKVTFADLVTANTVWTNQIKVGDNFIVDSNGNLTTNGDVTCNKGTFNNIVINSDKESSLVLTSGRIGGFYITSKTLTNDPSIEDWDFDIPTIAISGTSHPTIFIGDGRAGDTAISIGVTASRSSNPNYHAFEIEGYARFLGDVVTMSGDLISDNYVVGAFAAPASSTRAQVGITFDEGYDLDSVRLRVRNGIIIGLYNDDREAIIAPTEIEHRSSAIL